MGESKTESRWFRIAFGRPRLWNGVVHLVVAVVWLVVTVSEDRNGWGYLLVTIWGLLGGVVLAVAVHDARHGRGAYAQPVSHSEE
ncbi:hypothetical protein [Leifsonia sp. SIMBA_070]|uniref:hypothetical protein n=1 Tax=Leifsonia sp. SIMBA_070 TaxID=3085810 RepID=UPI00397DFA4B